MQRERHIPRTTPAGEHGREMRWTWDTSGQPYSGMDGGAERLGWSLPVLLWEVLAAEFLGGCFYYCFNSFFNLVFLLAALSLTH